MARQILCLNCDSELMHVAKSYGEYHESIEGEALTEYQCDNCGKTINQGEVCKATIVLPQKGDGAGVQKPSYWAHEFINIKKLK